MVTLPLESLSHFRIQEKSLGEPNQLPITQKIDDVSLLSNSTAKQPVWRSDGCVEVGLCFCQEIDAMEGTTEEDCKK
ncbi:hypothetical protein NL676_013613 [Syzygium grande]|nr:hypothetical protein NL676_013613 [Syzygium grande]